MDGAPVTDADREAYRQRFSAVFWDFHLFDWAADQVIKLAEGRVVSDMLSPGP